MSAFSWRPKISGRGTIGNALMYDQYSFTVVHSGVEYTPPEKTYLRAHVCVVVFMCACVDQKSFTVMHSGVEYAPPGESLFVRMCMCMCMCVCMCVCVCVLSPVPCQAAVIRVSESTLFC